MGATGGHEPTSAAASNATTLLCLVSFIFSSRCHSYGVKGGQAGLVGGKPVIVCF